MEEVCSQCITQTHTHTHTHTHTQHTHTRTCTHTGQSGSRLFLAQVLSRAHSAASLCSPKEQQEVWHSCITDLQRVKTLDKEVASSASCAAIFIQCQLLINKVISVISDGDRVHITHCNAFQYHIVSSEGEFQLKIVIYLIGLGIYL